MSELLLHNLGITATKKRTLRSGNEYDKYFPVPDFNDTVLLKNGSPEQTVNLMVDIVKKTKSDTEIISRILKGTTINETCQNIWNFIYNHIQYKLDELGKEQLRRPARLWAERTTGGDCDCMALFAASILYNLNIPYYFRITKYNGNDYYQHIYVVVPNGNKKIIIDPVMEQFNSEKQFSGNKDYAMNGIPVHFLSGLNEDLIDVLDATCLEGFGDNENVNPEALKNYLIQTKNLVKKNPELINSVEYPKAFIEMIEYLLENWDNPTSRAIALENLKRNEEEMNKLSGVFEDNTDDTETIITDEDLGALFKKKTPAEKAAKKQAKAAKKQAKAEKKATNKNKNFFTKVGDALKNGGKAFIKFNPIVIASRNGFLLFLKLNIKKAASKLKWAYATPQQAQKAGITPQKQAQAKNALAKTEKLYADKLQGKKDKLKDAILRGKAGGLNGFEQEEYFDSISQIGLGEVATATLFSAATPVIIACMKILQESGLLSKEEASNLEYELQNTSETDPAPYVTDESESDDTNTENKKGFFSWIKQNPIPVILGVGTIISGIVLFATKSKKTSNTENKPKQLNGIVGSIKKGNTKISKITLK
jgi:hypothetical protein